MSELYVNETAEFKCSAIEGSMTARELLNRSVKACGKLLMTAGGTKLSGIGNCKILLASGAPVPACVCKMSSSLSGWRGLSKNTAANSKLLLKNSYIPCNLGGVIRITDAGQRKVLKAGGESVEQIAALNIATVSSAQNASTENPNSVEPNIAVTENLSSAEKNSPPENITTETAPTQEKSFIPRTGLLCSCNAENPEAKCQTCEYRLDRRRNPQVANNSKTLRDNYEKAPHDQYDRHFDKLFSEPDSIGVSSGWSTAAHHIISGKQVLEEFPRLVKLARFCGYDVDDDQSKSHGINHYPNCIMLVGYPSDYGKSGVGDRDFAKSADADEVMSKSQMQWHVGSHQYRFAKGEKKLLRRRQREMQERQAVGSIFIDNMQTVLGRRREFRGQDLTIASYADLVKARLQELEDNLKSNPVCYQSESAKKNFISQIETVSRDIKQKLAAFREKPHRSYPYFVSLEAYLYAFAVPRTVHAVLIRSCQQGLRLTPWRITRYADTLQDANKSLSFKPSSEGIYLPKSKIPAGNDELIRKCLREVCLKARFFLLADITDEMQSEALSFLEDAEHATNSGTAYFFRLNGGEYSDLELLQENDSNIAVWLRRTAKKLAERSDLQGDTGVLRTRLQIAIGGR